MNENILLKEADLAKTTKIEEYLNNEPKRFENFTFNLDKLYFDFSKSRLSETGLNALIDSFGAKITQHRKKMFDGDAINFTENRAVMHFALRNKNRDWHAKGVSFSEKVKAEGARASEFANKIHNGEICAKNGSKFEAILHIGIGGSDLGPRLVYEALKPFDHMGPEIRFCANVEPTEFKNAIHGLNPAKTLVVCVSKTFTTIETLTNLKLARDWLQAAIGEDDMAHLVAISSATEKAIAQGFDSERIFGFEEWVGGRFSLWSAVGLSLEMAFGAKTINEFILGAKMMDEHFENAPINQNIPIIAGLLAYWNRKYMNFESRAIIPYAARLKLLPQFLQQLDMESNGKGVDLNGNKIEYSGPIVWGAEGTNAQHAFFQHLHQSPIITPLEFILIGDDKTGFTNSTRLTLANALAQSESLMRGKSLEIIENEMREKGASDEEIKKIAPHRVFEGNRPNSVIFMPVLSAFNFGAILSYYEHRCFVEGVLFDINSFDQWGVELGKIIALEIEADIKNGASPKRDKATTKLIEIIRNQNS